jgi:hypothetical protein
LFELEFEKEELAELDRAASLSDLLSPSILLGFVDLVLRLDDDSDLYSKSDDDVIYFLMK